MSIWDDAKTTLPGFHRYGDGLSWQITTQGIHLGDTPADPAMTETAAEVLAWLGDDLYSAAITASVPVELLVATVCTETVGTLGVGDAARTFRTTLTDYETDSASANLVRSGCCGMFLSIARIAAGLPFLTSYNLFDTRLALAAAAAHVAAAFQMTRLQPPSVASAYNVPLGVLFDQNSLWRMASYDGDPNRITRFVQWFNAAFLAINADPALASSAPNFSQTMAALTPQPAPPSSVPSAYMKPETQAAVDAGMMVLSPSHPALAVIWSVDDMTVSQIGDVAKDYAAGMGLPFGYPVFAYPDKSNTNRMMSGDEVVLLYRAMRDFIAGIRMYDADQAPSLPGVPVYLG